MTYIPPLESRKIKSSLESLLRGVHYAKYPIVLVFGLSLAYYAWQPIRERIVRVGVETSHTTGNYLKEGVQETVPEKSQELNKFENRNGGSEIDVAREEVRNTPLETKIETMNSELSLLVEVKDLNAEFACGWTNWDGEYNDKEILEDRLNNSSASSNLSGNGDIIDLISEGKRRFLAMDERFFEYSRYYFDEIDRRKKKGDNLYGTFLRAKPSELTPQLKELRNKILASNYLSSEYTNIKNSTLNDLPFKLRIKVKTDGGISEYSFTRFIIYKK